MVFKSRRNVCRILFFVFTLSLIMCSFTSLTAVGADSKTDTLEPVNLKWYVAGEGDQPDTSLVEDAVDKYLKNKINATVTIKTFGWGEYNEKMAVLFAAGEPFDMCFTSSWAAYYSPYSLVGAFKDLTDMMDTYAPKTKAFLGSTVLKGAEVNGRLYAIPNYQKNIACSYGIVLNKNLAQKYKVDVSKIKKLQDLEPIFKNVKAKAPNVIDFYPMDSTENNSVFVTLNYDELAGYRLPGAVQMNGNSTKVINQYDTPQAKTIFALMNKWYKQGYISKSSKDSGFFEKNKDNILAFYSTLDPFIKEDLANFNDLEVLPVELNKPFISTSSITFSLTAIP
ncbi:MAG TPA: extracellular solute-binding protein, partial [Ruminiclostridium sp.]|nr:extracellular solute-binding protein [Ruminiclostridium sp.]